jgi:hypothetical protein
LGNKKYPGKLTVVYGDQDLYTAIATDTAAVIDIYPEGSGTGKKYFEVAGALFKNWTLNTNQGAVVVQDADFAGTGVSVKTAT